MSQDKLFVMHHATCARKALLVCLEKDAAIETVEVERAYLTTPEYRSMNPSGLVPTLCLANGTVLVESTVIMRYIDEAYAGRSLQPEDTLERALMNLWLKQVDEIYFPAIGAPTIATFMRELFGVPPDEDRLSAMLDALTDYPTRVMREDCIRSGVSSGFVVAGLGKLREMLDRMEEKLSRTAWLMGETPTLADFATMPLIMRLAEFGLEDAWRHNRPCIKRWWDGVCARPSYEALDRLANKSLLSQLTDAVARHEKIRQTYLSHLT